MENIDSISYTKMNLKRLLFDDWYYKNKHSKTKSACGQLLAYAATERGKIKKIHAITNFLQHDGSNIDRIY